MKKLLSCALVLTLLVCACASAMAADLVIYSARNERLNNIVIPAFEQETLERFITGGYLERHIARMRTLYRARLKALRQGVQANTLGRLHPCDAGLYALLEAGGKAPACELVSLAAKEGVRLTRLADYAMMGEDGEDRRVLLGFAGMDEEEMAAGLAALARAWGTGIGPRNK